MVFFFFPWLKIAIQEWFVVVNNGDTGDTG